MLLDFNTLTSKQKKVYSAIESFVKQRGIPPTVREIGELVGEKTPGAVHGILNRLEQKGVIKREVGMARSIQLVSSESQYVKPAYVPELKKITPRTAADLVNMYNISKYHPISPDVSEAELNDCFIVKWHDDSLSESGIKPGDMLIFSRNLELADGDIVLALFQNRSLLRYYYKSDNAGSILLKAENDILEKELFDKNEIILLGKLAGRYTRY
ncbi:repressor LexA [Anaerobacterium chartisolvens]|uniref:Repressor LexA n=1 Tax=Anaerobacterium chartisolvens TaxID=1297424 RepID=A0A369B0E1_9FIRM|nr:S24 family peptidase [Anaerobacterium chartisolvens]RCX14795.1 repressor LexA [Anaerobacterium chartisolvens]